MSASPAYPTYREFREFALSKGLTPETLAPYVQSDSPEKAAERILVYLAGTRWDDKPLPYPRLCQLYHSDYPTDKPETSVRAPCILNQTLPLEVPDAPPLHRAWLDLFDAGWTLEKIADTWNQSLESVEAILDDLSQQPLPPEPYLLALPKTEAEGKKYRQLLRELAHRGWSQDSLNRITGGIYFPELLATITGKVSTSRKSRSTLDSKRTCPCCKKRVKGRQQYCSDACKMKAARGRKRSDLVSVD
jgi:hypothetical protein